MPSFMNKNNKNAKTNLSKKHTLQLHEAGVQNQSNSGHQSNNRGLRTKE